MRVYEVVLRSGARIEISAEVMHDDPNKDSKIYFYRDKGLNHLIAYFMRDHVSGIILGTDTGTSVPRHK